jgi:hypothetical protein
MAWERVLLITVGPMAPFPLGGDEVNRLLAESWDSEPSSIFEQFQRISGLLTVFTVRILPVPVAITTSA